MYFTKKQYKHVFNHIKDNVASINYNTCKNRNQTYANIDNIKNGAKNVFEKIKTTIISKKQCIPSKKYKHALNRIKDNLKITIHTKISITRTQRTFPSE